MKYIQSFFLCALAFHFAAPSSQAEPPKIEKLGTLECDLVEASPIVYRDRLYRYEYVREAYKYNTTGDSYFRFVGLESGVASADFGRGYHLGSAHVEGETVYAYGVSTWGASEIVVFKSNDLVTWASQTAVATPGWGLYNNHVCKAGDRYVMAIEVGEPPEVVGARFTMRFAESKNLLDWKLLPEDCVYTKEKYSACPDLHWFDGTFYMIYLEAYPGPSYNPHILRSKDLIEWESSPYNPIMTFSEEDKKIGNLKLTEEERNHIREAKNINNSDVEVCEFEGKTILYYSWGNQQGTEFLAHARYDGPVKEFLSGFYP
jgi:hypothetical protein